MRRSAFFHYSIGVKAMPKPLIITVAVTGAETTREQCPGLPITPEEIADDAARAFEAGASILHLHVRRDDGSPTQDKDIFAKAIELVRAKCPILIEVTTGGAAGMPDEERLQPVSLKPEMASLDCGSCNFGDEVLLNSLPQMRAYGKLMREHGVKPSFECFDLGHINNAKMMIDEGFADPPFHFSFVMGVPGALPATIKNLRFMVEDIPEDCLWTCIAIGGKASTLLHPEAIALGGHVRVGFEDNIYLGKGSIASSNADLVAKVAGMAKAAGRDLANVDEARKQLGIRAL